MLTTHLALSVDCPQCFQPAGMSCRVIGNKHREPRAPHEARYRRGIDRAQARAVPRVTLLTSAEYRALRVLEQQEGPCAE